MKLLLTGGCGFIGSAVVRHLLRKTDHVVINVDKLTYAASEDALEEGRHHNRHVLIRALQRHADLVLVALLEKNRTNLALARFQLLEVERSLP